MKNHYSISDTSYLPPYVLAECLFSFDICSVGYTCGNNMQNIGVLTRNKSYIDSFTSMALHPVSPYRLKFIYKAVDEKDFWVDLRDGRNAYKIEV